MNRSYSVIIPFRGSLHILEKVLSSLENADYPDKEVILVNDGTDYDFIPLLKKYRCSLINLSGRCGPSFARNRGAKAANFEYLIFLDSDVVVSRDCFVKINDFLKDNPSFSVINCPVSAHSPYDNFFSQYANMMFRYDVLKKGRYALFTSFCVISSKSFWDVGGFDQDICLPYADDDVLGWKLYNKRYKFALIEGIEIVHYKQMFFTKFLIFCLLHGFFYAKFRTIYRKRLNFFRIGFKNEGMLFFATLLFFSILTYYKIFSIPVNVLILSALFLVIHADFFWFLLKAKKCLFVCKGIVTLFSWYIIYSISAIAGMLNGFFRKDKVLRETYKNVCA